MRFSIRIDKLITRMTKKNFFPLQINICLTQPILVVSQFYYFYYNNSKKIIVKLNIIVYLYILILNLYYLIKN